MELSSGSIMIIQLKLFEQIITLLKNLRKKIEVEGFVIWGGMWNHLGAL
jgi:hypothetical protein